MFSWRIDLDDLNIDIMKKDDVWFTNILCSRQWESWPYPVQDFTFIHLLSWNSMVKIHPPFTFIDRKLGQDSPFGVIY